MKAAIDIGSNSLRLLVGGTREGKNIVLEQQVEETRLGEGCCSRLLTEASIARTMAVLARWAEKLAQAKVEEIYIFATSAVRDAANQKEFADRIRRGLGWELRILTGEEEAFYSFSGAASVLPYPREEVLLFDIGGGSTEITGYEEGTLVGVSAPLGAVRWKGMSYTEEEAGGILWRTLAGHRFSQAKYFVGVGGTITTAAAVLCEVAGYCRAAIQGKRMEKSSLTALRSKLAALSLAERKKLVGMPEKRADIILYGLDILLLLFAHFSVPEIYVSDAGILDGILFS